MHEIYSNKRTDTVRKVFVFGVFLVRNFPHSDWLRRYTPYLSIFSPNAGKCEPEKLQIRTIFTQCNITVNKRTHVDVMNYTEIHLIFEILNRNCLMEVLNTKVILFKSSYKALLSLATFWENRSQIPNCTNIKRYIN